jgi:branched-chain amino acid aminotransferase
MANLCNIDGRIVPEHEATVPVLDRGFLFGDSIYEVVRTRNGSLFAWQEHLDRLRASALGIGMELSLDDATILRRILDTMHASGNAEHYVRIVVTRGTGTAPSIDLRTAPGPERWILFARPLPQAPTDVRLQIIDRLRNDRRALDPAVKSGNYLHNVLGLAEAKQTGATDCLFLNASGHLTEASTSNVFVVKNGIWLTPPAHAGILLGVTRAMLIELLRARGERVLERDLTRDDAITADAVFTSSTLRDVALVTHVDGIAMQEGETAKRVLAIGAEFTLACDRRATDVDMPAAIELAQRAK